jgi:hypothetical protein
MARLIECIECGNKVSSAIFTCPRCSNAIRGIQCAVCQCVGKKSELQTHKSSIQGFSFRIHPACLLRVVEERDSPMHVCALCRHKEPAAFCSACAQCGHPVGRWLASACVYCNEYVVHAHGHFVKKAERRVYFPNSKYAHKICFCSRRPFVAWLSRAFH